MKHTPSGLFGSSRWWIEHDAMHGLIERYAAITPEARQAAEAKAAAYVQSSDPTMVGDIAVIPIAGPIFYKPSWYACYFGGAILTTIRAQFRTAVNDPNVKGIVFPFDSPGGIVDMVPEFAKELFAARGKKPLMAVADTLIASAAYWLASQCDQIYVTESSRVGSIGVYCEHEEISAMLEKVGIKVTLIAYGDHKVDGNPYEPLSDDARAKIQADVNRTGDKFTTAVARGRGVSKKIVLSTFGQGQVFDGETAITLGMADKIGTFEQVTGKTGKSRGSRAAAVVPVVHAESDDNGDEPVAPNEDGTCPEGYVLDGDLCYLIDPDEPAEPTDDAKAAATKAAAQDEAAILAALAK